MAMRKLSDVYNLPLAVYTGTAEPLASRDLIYPRKQDIGVGSRFSFHGHRQDSPSEWVVEAIYTESFSESGRQIESYVAIVKLLDDRVVLRCEETGVARSVQCRHLSYSAAWRLKEKGA